MQYDSRLLHPACVSRVAAWCEQCRHEPHSIARWIFDTHDVSGRYVVLPQFSGVDYPENAVEFIVPKNQNIKREREHVKSAITYHNPTDRQTHVQS
jgi:hypothetical protein